MEEEKKEKTGNLSTSQEDKNTADMASIYAIITKRSPASSQREEQNAEEASSTEKGGATTNAKPASETATHETPQRLERMQALKEIASKIPGRGSDTNGSVIGVSLKAATRVKDLDELCVVRRATNRGKNQEAPHRRIQCISCLSEFENLESIQQHLARRITLLVCYCSPCKSRHVYLNPCTLKAHLLAFNVNTLMDGDKARVYKLPLHPLFSGTRTIRLFDQTKGAHLTTEMCPACGTLVASTAAHLQATEAGGGKWCHPCGKLYPSTCMLILHHKLYHTTTTDGTANCPECGKPQPNRDLLRAHAAVDCMHLNRIHRYRCQMGHPYLKPCGKDHVTTTELAKHYTEAHSTIKVKCGTCPQTFMNKTAALLHVETANHKQQDPHPQISLVEQCPLCDHVVKAAETFIGHILQTHEYIMAKKSPVSIFVCPYKCEKGFDGAGELRKHLLYEHDTKIPPEAAAATTAAKRPKSSEEEKTAKKQRHHAAYNNLETRGPGGRDGEKPSAPRCV